MKFRAEIYNYDCESLEEIIVKRESIKGILTNFHYSKKLDRCINEYSTFKFKKHIDVNVYVNELCNYIIFEITNSCTKEENEVIAKILKAQLSDGVFENFPYNIEWDLERI